MIAPTTYADDQRLRDASAALGDACETPEYSGRCAPAADNPRSATRSAWTLIDGDIARDPQLPPAVRVAREIAAAVIHHAILEVWSQRRAGALRGMRITGVSPSETNDQACMMTMPELCLLIEFLCSFALDEWIDQFGLHISADAVRRHLRIHDPAADLAALAAYRDSVQRIGPGRAAATCAAGLATPKAHRRPSAYAMVTARPVRVPFAAPPRKRRGYIA
jgi:hypothetical protein